MNDRHRRAQRLRRAEWESLSYREKLVRASIQAKASLQQLGKSQLEANVQAMASALGRMFGHD